MAFKCKDAGRPADVLVCLQKGGSMEKQPPNFFGQVVSLSKNGGRDILLSTYERFYGFFVHSKSFWFSSIHDPMTGKTITKGRFDGEDAAQFNIAVCIVGHDKNNFFVVFTMKNRYTDEESTFCIGRNEPGYDPVMSFYIIGDKNKGNAVLKAHWIIEGAAADNVCFYNELISKKRKTRMDFICNLLNHFVPTAMEPALLTRSDVYEEKN